MADDQAREETRKRLVELFAGYRAEWLKEDVFQLFTEPSYFPQLEANYPCFLVGGRGSGKTTVLRCMSYEGRFAMAGEQRDAVPTWDYFGFYYRINTNRVAAFQGSELDESMWARLFGHYTNLELCERVFRFLNWYSALFPDEECLTAQMLEPFSASMMYEVSLDQGAMAERLELSRLRFEAQVNSIGDSASGLQLTLQGAPVDALMRAVARLPQFKGRHFFFLIDEYENLSDLQQRVFNTLIKHCGELYSFKVGVRDLGLRQRSTLMPQEQLVHPADFKRIDIADELGGRFAEFAERVCHQRLTKALGDTCLVPTLDEVLPALSAEEEAELLGVAALAEGIRGELTTATTHLAPHLEWASSLPNLEVFTLACRARAEDVSLADKAREAFEDQVVWRRQYENHQYAYLFVIRPRKRGIRKYYAGWKTYCALSSNNLRYLLELVDQAVTKQMDSGGPPLGPIDVGLQTEAAQLVGQKNLQELEGLTVYGAKLTHMLLGLGRVFQVMAEDPIGHTPEVNEFKIESGGGGHQTPEEATQVADLLQAAVMNLALLRYSASKLQEESDIKQWDFAVHPIYAAFFGFSHRKKRKITLSQEEMLTLVSDTSAGVKGILKRQNRVEPEELPDQLQLFEAVYAD